MPTECDYPFVGRWNEYCYSRSHCWKRNPWVLHNSGPC